MGFEVTHPTGKYWANNRYAAERFVELFRQNTGVTLRIDENVEADGSWGDETYGYSDPAEADDWYCGDIACECERIHYNNHGA
jgi:hypothetical protein